MYIKPGRGRFSPRRLPIMNIPNMAGGLNDKEGAEEINVTQMSDCENITVDEGIIKSAPGWNKVDVATGSPASYGAGPFYAIYQFNKSDGTEVFLRMRQNTLEYATSGNTLTWASCTVPITLTDGLYPTFITLNDVVVMSNGTDNVISSADGVTWTERATLKKGRIIINNGRNRTLYTGISSDPSIIWWSDINDPLTIGASSYQYIEPNDGQKIEGIGRTPWGSILVFKTSNIYEISDIDFGLINVNLVAQNTSLMSHQSVQTTENSVIWMGYDGIYEYISGTVRKISNNLKNTERNFIQIGKTCCSIYGNFKYRLAIPDHEVSDSYNAQEYVFHKDLGTGEFDNPYPITRNERFIGCYGKANWEDSTGEKHLETFFGDSRSTAGSPATTYTDFGIINDRELGSDEGYDNGLNGSAQSCYFTSKFFTNDENYYAKRFLKFFLDVRANQDFNITIGYRFDPYDDFTEVSEAISSPSLEWEYDSTETGNWTMDDSALSNWAYGGKSTVFSDIEYSKNEPRGIQFKVSWETTEAVEIIGMAFKFLPKSQFK